MTRRNWIAAIACVLACTACAHGPTGKTSTHEKVDRREMLMAVLWMQRAAEFRISTMQVYRDATAKLPIALASGSGGGTAAAEQENLPGYEKLPPAVVLDIDETVLDNSRYQAWRLKTGNEFEPASWGAWIRLAQAPAIPGAVEFTRAAVQQGYRVLYISNRDCKQVRPAPCADKASTIENLKRAGLPLQDDDDVLFRGEKEGWYGKEARRLEVAGKYRIAMLLGDDLRDLMPTVVVDDLRKPGGDARNERHLAKLGTSRFLIPNPAYGSWEDFIVAERCKSGDVACYERAAQRRFDALDVVDLKP